MTPRQAIILAAGQGIRLRSVVDDRPKGLIEIGGETLVRRSVRLLRAAGITRLVLVAGYHADQFQRFAADQSDIALVTNGAYASTGSMASLAIAIDTASIEDALVLESDIIYEPRALTAILVTAADDSTLVSGPTGAGDEVWVHAVDGRLGTMSKDRSALPNAIGEFVGITRLSAAAVDEMREAFDRFARVNGHGRMDYETGALVAVAQRLPVSTVVVPDLQWGEIDDERHYARVSAMTWA